MAKELTQEERERRNAYKREWARAKKAKLNAIKEEQGAIVSRDLNAQLADAKIMIRNLTAEKETLQAKVIELDKLCGSYARNAANAETLLKRATLEYNTRTKYMLDCVKHAYISIQMAEASAEKENDND